MEHFFVRLLKPMNSSCTDVCAFSLGIPFWSIKMELIADWPHLNSVFCLWVVTYQACLICNESAILLFFLTHSYDNVLCLPRDTLRHYTHSFGGSYPSDILHELRMKEEDLIIQRQPSQFHEKNIQHGAWLWSTFLPKCLRQIGT